MRENIQNFQLFAWNFEQKEKIDNEAMLYYYINIRDLKIRNEPVFLPLNFFADERVG